MRGSIVHARWPILAALGLLAVSGPLGNASATPTHAAPALSGGNLSATAYGADDWPVYMHDAARSGGVPNDTGLAGANLSHLRTIWTYATGGLIAAQPAVVNGTVYVGSWDGWEYALNASTGARVWARNLSTVVYPNCGDEARGITSSASVVGNIVYVGAATGNWYALNASTGRTLWHIFLGNTSQYYNWGSPLIHGGYAYLGIASGCDVPLVRGALWMVSLTTHQAVHRTYTVAKGTRGGSIWGSPTYDAATNSIFVTTGNGQSVNQQLAEAVVAFNASTLAIESHWHVPRPQVGGDSDFGVTPTLFDGALGGGQSPVVPMVGAANKNGVFYAWNRTNLSSGPAWSFRIAHGGPCPECGEGSVSSAVTSGGRLFVAGGLTTLGNVTYNGSVAALDPSNGSVLWQVGLAGKVLPALTVGDGVVLAESGSRLIALNVTSGAPVFSYGTGATLYGSASIAEGCIFVGSTNGRLFAFGIRSVGCGPEVAAPDSVTPGGPPAAHSPFGASGGRSGLLGRAASGASIVRRPDGARRR